MGMDAATADANRRKAEADARKAERGNAIEATDQSFARAKTLRGDYEALPSVKSYTAALPVFGAGLQSHPDAAGDLNLIYAYAKVMDPNSVVREGEQASVAGGDTWINSKVAQLQKQLGQGGTFKPDFRKRLREEMGGRMGELNQSFIADRVRYKGISDRYGVNPQDVVGEHPGSRFQALSERVLGKEQQQLDYDGLPIATTAASGPTRNERDPNIEARVDDMIRRGMNADQINRALPADAVGPRVAQEQVSAAQAYLRTHPYYTGGFADTSRDVPNSVAARVAGSPLGTAVGSAVDQAFGGLLDEGVGAINSAFTGQSFTDATAEANAKKQAAFTANPGSALIGGMAGIAGSMTGLSAVSRALGISEALGKGAPYIGDLAFGAASGAGQSNGNRLTGAALGGVAGIGGRYLGEMAAVPIGAALRSKPLEAVANGARGMFGRGPLNRIPAPLPAEQAAADALSKAGLPGVQSSLAEAQQLGVPMSLADAHPALRSLAGASVRRSPVAAEYGESQLLPRSRGQIDRFGQAVERDLGPVGNVPQLSADMTQQARTAAGPLYDRAYRQPVMSTPELDATLNTPFGRSALNRANTIAANERRSPTELGFAQGPDGSSLLNPRPNRAIADHLSARDELDAAQEAYRSTRSGPGDKEAARARVERARENMRNAERGLSAAPDPSMPANVPGYTTQSLDYVKRGMDDVLEQYRNPITNRLQLDEAGRAQSMVKNQFLGEVDRINPAYGDARSAYAGPVQARDAMARGQDALTLNPDELAMQVANQTPEHLGQMQLGYRSSLMDAAERQRFSSNPFDATLGTPVAERRLSTLYPNNPGVPRLLRTRDLEGQMARTNNEVLGNSRTAERTIADQEFAGGGLGPIAADAGLNLALGQVPTRAITSGLAALSKDTLRLGVGKRATAKAEALAPILLNPNPAAASGEASRLAKAAADYQAYVQSLRPTRPLGMFGRSFGTLAAGQYAGSMSQ